ncbi:hypothetical protein GCM10010517_51990 [Streptosporangium fragile]|uniref:Uncharacterized protein n=1 Tax=Streptosporangium fragile TaxID=46186 RepID=A0ABN3W350_9ACTN
MSSSTGPGGSGADHPVAVLRRWEEFGAVWRVVSRDAEQVTISLCQCDGGEEVGRIVSGDPALLTFLGERTGSHE